MPEPKTPEPLPAELRALAADAETLALRTAEMAARLKAADDGQLNRLARPMVRATDELDGYTEEVSRTAEYLARVRVARDPNLCDVPWGICPEHGTTLRADADRTRCTAPGCGREWDYDRLHSPCTEPATVTVTDEDGESGVLCVTHAQDATRRLVGCTFHHRGTFTG
ncbi:hypothetical protein [Amycolatopsis sp. PS_44_ISF1]|uniref:hypothetical protein n=1 Tax=Amycolatopsis sp. PS_44_ISF1 TaxID=2974917 RepID=UPI0028DDEA2A|nr:hypothetical protein [Amycolatopsis sp. PS_44_ISF1]MDT8915154.1 hypothetical protein [Amycolatopsis sp. PS_44_ISF1]